MLYLLDTNIVSHFIKDPAGRIGRRVLREGDQAVATSIIVAAELRFGVELKQSLRLAAQVEEALSRLTVLPLEDDADRHYARVRAELQRRGTPIGGNDLLIAAHALTLGATLVSDNVREFARVDGLPVENWLRDD